MSVRQHLIDHLKAKIAEVKKINGYNTDLGLNIFEWRDHPLTKDELPGVIIRDSLNRRITPTSIAKFRWALRIEIAVFGRTPQEIRAGIEDVLKVLRQCEEEKWGGQAEWTTLADGDEMSFERYDIEIGAAIITFDVIYETDMWSM